MVVVGVGVGGGGSRLEGGNQVVSARIRKTIQSIKEIVGDHSDADIYAVLKETDMDPNETTQKLLTQDPFHEVKRKRDKRKEQAGYKSSNDTRKQVEHNGQRTNSRSPGFRNDRRRANTRSAMTDAGVNQEFRIVRDNRMNNNEDMEKKTELAQHRSPEHEESISNVPEKSSADVRTDRKHSSTRNSVKYHPSRELAKNCKHLLPGQTRETTTIPHARREGQSSPQKNSATESSIGVYSLNFDPVHVPSPESKAAGTHGAIRREVGVVGARRPSQSSVPSSSNPDPIWGKDSSNLAGLSGLSAYTSKGSQTSQAPASEIMLRGVTITRYSQRSNKSHQPSAGHQKAMQRNMEWKPKTSLKSTTISPAVTMTTPAAALADTSNLSAVDVNGLSNKLSQANISDDRHVIIPEHLRVPESEYACLTFGSFGVGLDPTEGLTSASQAFEKSEQFNEPCSSISESVPIVSNEVASASEHKDIDDLERSLQFDSFAPAAETDETPQEINGSLNSQKADDYADIGLVQSDSPLFSSAEAQKLQNPPSLPSFSVYDSHTSDDAPFFRTAIGDNVHSLGLDSPSEGLSSHIASSSSPAIVTTQQQQQQQLVQPQPVTQLYPQVHISHFPNFMPYRHIISPVYVPPMAMPNYSTNIAYPHPPNGSNYLVMPGGSSHLNAGGLKYGASQYKSAPSGTGYGNYTHPAGFTISSPGAFGGTTGLEEMARVKFKDNNLYVPNPQPETSDIWIQTPREVPTLQSPQYYNLSGQATHASFMPTHAGHASFNAAAQSSNVQYPGLYHPQQQASIVGPHHLVHQQVPSPLGGSVGAAPGPQVGAYQQPQLGHLNWTTNF
ncbi:uncharacterized protein LOC109711862 isoform X3 [Ananas comosus]|uniref:Uncharacterized protein LOC109711862 isoform X3 n=1 Tax=Ananas comosus TaxID=4615 RepID=A0A6P5FBT2_ANACO|nr:uncharacterized protein LOC109711862 isoform X3 [Ananas comosus]